MENKPIGIFDSGIGGLTVLKEVNKILPHEDLIYLGDTARVPYGIRSPETVIKYSLQCAEFLYKKGIKLLIVACNTSSSISLDTLKKNFHIPIIGVIEPGAKSALKVTKNNRIGIIGTEATVQSGAYPKIIKSFNPQVMVISKACPLFVPLVEEGITEGNIADLVIERYLKEIKETKIDTLILGCTHYPLLKKAIKKYLNEINLVDSAEAVARDVKKLLKEKGLLNSQKAEGKKIFYVTDSPERFKKIGEMFLNFNIENMSKILLEEEVNIK